VGVVRLQEPLHVLGIHSLGARREPDEVGKHHRDDLAFLAEGTCFPIEREPHALQNRAPVGFSCRQTWHVGIEKAYNGISYQTP